MLGASAEARSAPAASPMNEPARPPNILLIVLDCARAKSFAGDADGQRARTPVIDGLARRGTRFSRAVAPANWTIPSHMSLFTGTYPSAHGVRTFSKGTPSSETLAASLRRRGYDTAMFTEMVHLVAGYGLEDGYDHRIARWYGMADEARTRSNRIAARSRWLYSARMRGLLARFPPAILPLNIYNHRQEVAFKQEVCGRLAEAEFEHWLSARRSDRPFHAFFNLVDTHEPYPEIPNGHRAGLLARWYARTPRYYLLAVPRLQRLVPWNELLAWYRGSIEAADAKVGRILGALARAGESDRTMVIVTSDHGQSFGEGGNVFHGCGATDSITRVPLVVAAPTGISLPTEVDRWTSLCELYSWARAAADGRVPFDDAGHAPPPYAAMAPPDSTVFCEGAPASDPNRSLQGVGTEASWNHRLLAAYRTEAKYVLDLDTNEILRWDAAIADPDVAEPERWTGADAEGLRRRIFGAYDRPGPAEKVAPTRDSVVQLDARLRSWGYD